MPADMTGSLERPKETEVVVIGGGVAGVSTAYFLAKSGVPVVLCEKGRIAGEQSSRNWGWIRKQGRDHRELALGVDSLRRWHEIVPDLDEDIGFTVGGVTYLAETEADLARHESWLEGAQPFQLDSRLLTPAEVDDMLGQDRRRFLGGLHTPSDAKAEPTKAVPAIARAAQRHGATIMEKTAVRTIDQEGGRVSGVVTEHGRIRCRSVVLAGGVWSRPFLENLGLGLPQLGVQASAQRTTTAPKISDSTFGAKGAAIRYRADGGYTVARSSAATFDIIPAAFTHFLRFLPVVYDRMAILKLRFGGSFFGALGRKRWAPDQMSPFETVRVMDPAPDHKLLDDIMMRAADLYPQLADARPAEWWGGMIDVTPDELPVIGAVASVPGLFMATGFSGHGFGSGPAAGAAVSHLVKGEDPMVDLESLTPARFGL